MKLANRLVAGSVGLAGMLNLTGCIPFMAGYIGGSLANPRNPVYVPVPTPAPQQNPTGFSIKNGYFRAEGETPFKKWIDGANGGLINGIMEGNEFVNFYPEVEINTQVQVYITAHLINAKGSTLNGEMRTAEGILAYTASPSFVGEDGEVLLPWPIQLKKIVEESPSESYSTRMYMNGKSVEEFRFKNTNFQQFQQSSLRFGN
ncbi:MAG: hypothetical protein AABW79_04635 [Nanoarchaeota archaeon]